MSRWMAANSWIEKLENNCKIWKGTRQTPNFLEEETQANVDFSGNIKVMRIFNSLMPYFAYRIDSYRKIHLEEIQATALAKTTEAGKINNGGSLCYVKTQPSKINKYLLQETGDTFILGCDLNVKKRIWGSNLRFTKGSHWRSGQRQIPDSLDFFITKKISENLARMEKALI